MMSRKKKTSALLHGSSSLLHCSDNRHSIFEDFFRISAFFSQETRHGHFNFLYFFWVIRLHSCCQIPILPRWGKHTQLHDETFPMWVILFVTHKSNNIMSTPPENGVNLKTVHSVLQVSSRVLAAPALVAYSAKSTACPSTKNIYCCHFIHLYMQCR